MQIIPSHIVTCVTGPKIVMNLQNITIQDRSDIDVIPEILQTLFEGQK